MPTLSHSPVEGGGRETVFSGQLKSKFQNKRPHYIVSTTWYADAMPIGDFA